MATDPMVNELRAYSEDLRAQERHAGRHGGEGEGGGGEAEQLEQALRNLFSKFGIQDNRARERSRTPTEAVASNVLAALMSAPFYPIRLVQVLMQLGYEPTAPQRRFSFFFQRYLYYYPGIIGYTKAIVRQAGWRALYRGVGSNILENIVLSSSAYFLQPRVEALVEKLPLTVVANDNGDVPDTEENVETARAIFVRATKRFLLMSLTSMSVEVVVHPFHVITIRSIAQHVGREGIYDSVWGSIQEIYREEGFSGFYAGLLPALLHHVCTAAIHSLLWVFFRMFFRVVASSWSTWVRLFIVVGIEKPTLALVPRSYSYPLHLMSTVMATNDCRLVVGAPPRLPVFRRWTDCYSHLRASHSLYRGSSWLFPRFAYVAPPKRALS